MNEHGEAFRNRPLALITLRGLVERGLTGAGEWLVGKRHLSNHSLDALLTDYKRDNTRDEIRQLTPA